MVANMKWLTTLSTVALLTACGGGSDSILSSGGSGGGSGGSLGDVSTSLDSMEKRFGRAFGGSYSLACSQAGTGITTKHLLSISANGKTTFDGVVAYDGAAKRGRITIDPNTVATADPSVSISNTVFSGNTIKEVINIDLDYYPNTSEPRNISVSLDDDTTEYSCKLEGLQSYPKPTLFTDEIIGVVSEVSPSSAKVSCTDSDNKKTSETFSRDSSGKLSFKGKTWTVDPDYQNDWDIDFGYLNASSTLSSRYRSVGLMAPDNAKGTLSFTLQQVSGRTVSTMGYGGELSVGICR